MRGVRRSCALFIAVLAVGPHAIYAQGLTGAMAGTVKDQQGGVLPGAVVRIASPALLGGDQQTTTDPKGAWRFPVLAPGSYVLTVEMGPKFKPFHEEQIRIGPAMELDRDVVLQLAGVTQSVTVDAGTSTTIGSGLETRFGSEYIETIPSTRNSMFDLIRSAPGVSPTSPASRTTTTLSVFGSAVNENKFLIDGTNFTCPCQGVSRAEPIVDAIEEVQVQSAGASVEYGNIQGAVFNVVTKQGSDRFAAESSYYGQWPDLTAQPIVLPVSHGTVPSSGYERIEYRDFTTDLGGPVMRDRLWFYSAYQYLRDYDNQPGADPAFPRAYEQNKVFGKLNWRLSPSVRLMQSFHYEDWENPTPPTVATPFVATNSDKGTVPTSTFFDLTQTLANKTVWEVRAGRFIQRQRVDTATGDHTTPPHFDQVTGVSSGNAPSFGGPTFDRLSAKAVLSRYQTGWLGTDHAFKTGLEIERGQHDVVTVIPGGVEYIDNNNAPFEAAYTNPSISGGRFITSSAFASDSFAIRNRATIDAGIRFDHSDASSQDLPAIDAQGNDTGGTIPGFGHLYTWNAFSPRFGASVKLTQDARTMLRGTYGRYNQGVLTGELSLLSPGNMPTTTMAYNAATGGYTTFVSTVDPKVNLSIDPHTHTPHSDEYTLGVDRELGSQIRASVAYVGKRGSDYIGWTDTGGQYQQETTTLPNGVVLPVFVLTNSTADRRFLLTNQPNLFLRYDGLLLTMEKRMYRRWQVSGSYTYSRAYGMLATSNAPASEAQFSTIARPVDLTFGQDPNNLTNATGRLPNDRPNIFRTTGQWQLPWQGLLVVANLQAFSGRPWAPTAQVTLPQGSERILVEPRGSERLPSEYLLDVRVSKTFHLSSARTVDALFDVLNLLNDSAAEAIQTDNIASAAFGHATQFMDPRRLMVGVRLNLGR